MEKPMIRELTTQEKFKDIRMLAHNLQIGIVENEIDKHYNEKDFPHFYKRLKKIISICDEQIETTNKIVDDHAKEGERNA